MITRLSTSPRRSGARTRSAAPLLAGLTLAVGLTGCGNGADDPAVDTATDPEPTSSTPSPTEKPSQTPTDPSEGSGTVTGATIEATGSAGVTEATLLSATEAGGAESTLAFALDTDQARSDFAAQFGAGFGSAVSETAADEAASWSGVTIYGATVSIGCDEPRAVAIEAGEAGFEVTPRLPEKGVQCLAPVTYVVLFGAPNA